MAFCTESNSVTVQGLGTPVPAPGQGGRAGPQASLTGNRKAAAVDHLATAAALATSDVDTTKVPLSPSIGSMGEESLLKEVQEAEYKMERCLKEMKALIGVMLAAIKKQPNVNKDIKSSLPKMEELLDLLHEGRRASSAGREKLVKKLEVRLKKPAVTAKHHSSSAAASTPKRAATSPPLPVTANKQKKKKPDPAELGWTTVQPRKRKQGGEKQVGTPSSTANGKAAEVGKKKKRKPQARRKAEAILLKPSGGKTFAEVLGTIRKSVKPEDCGAEVRSIRRTRAGELLLELRNTSPNARLGFTDALKKAVGEDSDVRELIPKDRIEIRDMDGCTSKEEVETALRSVLPEYVGALDIVVFRTNNQGQCMAVVAMEQPAAVKVLQLSHIKIGWVSCRIRRRTTVSRCYKCLGYGHESRQCKGLDRSTLCFRCGTANHRSAVCKAIPRCFLCAEGQEKPEDCKHVAGSGTCKVFREALQKATGR
ncbi:uncharacterized protein LOC123988938 [Osmia bicornis bicornis]|uniref:uncharacterized protein LOC123988938 n=1 Tax=Osmia bicornis bicornis TaxID=1437191 RepID=UPI001EAEDB48|nr:uncharacterized protein LOC123988938 [Osmia bicornis bicornis]